MLGRGGMGEVRVAHDARLDREVAVKTVAPGDAVAAARLAREARLTARLEHPGIMPVYEAGRGDDGRPWYAMRLFVGRTLADALAAAPAPAERLRLVRHVLDAAYAVAYAHDQGILHRDLTPRNVITGHFGETIVADWGLACTREEARAAEPGVGTPGYMAPEQVRGGELDARADVYALGAVLGAVLAGHASDGDPAAAMRAAEGVPPELVAVAERALRPDRAERYPDARAFADDLLAWFEGRRVAAHAYTPTELLRRLVQAWRVPLLVAAGGLAAVGVAAAVGYAATAEERARAEASEAAATQARADEERAFAAALRVQALLAAGEDLAMEAEILAAHALRRAEGPEARGVLAAAYGRPRWARVALREQPDGCRRKSLSRDGTQMVCLGEASARLVEVESGRSLWETPGAYFRSGILDPSTLILLGHRGSLVLARPEGATTLLTFGAAPEGAFPRPPPGPWIGLEGAPQEIGVEVATGRVVQTRWCGEDAGADGVVATPAGELVVTCTDGRVFAGPPGERPRLLATLPPGDGALTFVEVLDGGRLVVGTARGWVHILAPDGAPLLRRRLGAEAPFTASGRDDRLAVGLASGDVVVWDIATDVVAMRFRPGTAQAAWLADGTLRILGPRLEDRAAPTEVRPHRMSVNAGVAALVWSPDGALVAAGGGDGRTMVLDARTGGVVHRFALGDAVVKDVGFSPDGRALLATSAGKRHAVWSLADGAELDTVEGFAARRGVWLPQAGVVLAPYARSFWRLPVLGAEAVEVLGQGFVDLELAPDLRLGAAVAGDGSVYRVDDGPEPAFTLLGDYDDATGVAAGGDRVVLGREREIVALGRDGAVAWRAPVAGQSTDVAASADGAWAAVGLLDGSVLVYAVGEATPRARLAGHHARVSALAFSPDGAWLASGAWDGEVRTWSVAALDAPAAETAATVERAWGSTLDEVLGTVVLPQGG